MTATEAEEVKHAKLLRNSALLVRGGIGAASLVTGIVWIAGTSADRALGLSFLLFGTFTLLHDIVDALVIAALDTEKARTTNASGSGAALPPREGNAGTPLPDPASSNEGGEDPPSTGPESAGTARITSDIQGAVIAAAGTVLGLISAFAAGALPVATKVAVGCLAFALLLGIVVMASGARAVKPLRARGVGLFLDILSFLTFSFGVIALVLSLIITGGLGSGASGKHTGSSESGSQSNGQTTTTKLQSPATTCACSHPITTTVPCSTTTATSTSTTSSTIPSGTATLPRSL